MSGRPSCTILQIRHIAEQYHGTDYNRSFGLPKRQVLMLHAATRRESSNNVWRSVRSSDPGEYPTPRIALGSPAKTAARAPPTLTAVYRGNARQLPMQPRQLFQAVATEPLERSGKQYRPERCQYVTPGLTTNWSMTLEWARSGLEKQLRAPSVPTPAQRPIEKSPFPVSTVTPTPG